MDKKKDFNPTGISLTQVEAGIVQEVSLYRGINSFSGAVRMIIREWYELTTGKKVEDIGRDK